jgi:hypothetical protein
VTGEVISFGSRRPLAEDQAAQQHLDQQDAALEDLKVSTHNEAMAITFAETCNLVETNKMNAAIVIGRSPEGLFFTEVMLDPREIARNDVFAWIGAMEALKLELMDLAQMAPLMLSDGSILDPQDQMPVFEEYDE